jgi:hypothetical protein
VDDDQIGEANPGAWSASSITSRYGDEVRLERKVASGVAGCWRMGDGTKRFLVHGKEQPVGNPKRKV